MTYLNNPASTTFTNIQETSFIHIPVLSQEVITGLKICPGGHYLDATVGSGGHSFLILNTFQDVRITAIDRDQQAIAAATAKLKKFGRERVRLWQGNFADYPGKKAEFSGIITDLGVSSPQFDIPERGFSFRHEASLDMRMDQNQLLTAAEIINHWNEKSLVELFFHYGEERRSRLIAKRIVEQRPFHTTTQLAQAIAHTVPLKYRYGRIHPATRIFQALRIAVNEELVSLEKFLERVPQWLQPGGRLGIISFHSLEDRIVKHRFRDSLTLTVVNKKPITSHPQEKARNPRSRSAKLRFSQRVKD
ncbi:S-adenosyl-methyltransferase MraW [cyanobacterium endosymbiont of Rhopalodia gibberula]|uniref:16S rRNA (cytosine(1402)-N(4))-methyltransferase RsmH n=1 Tax=cyanobacterium endosymbiont of Rhopalodia gibberula TaxID=1763363 RepID=UPI000DC6D88F|nr:16S rRNA (cytosine(1402)-N(4))-methyltransferase RsmH [cyanobacterium endosymbiont of Rhopalodia gibberula]BBA78896.1 S-adenosyl-methyltransferase MraW [cyanobacterium endosymbiont of Rhopalodia gibberula]